MAARIESASKEFGIDILVSKEVVLVGGDGMRVQTILAACRPVTPPLLAWLDDHFERHVARLSEVSRPVPDCTGS